MNLLPGIMNEVFNRVECLYPFRNELRTKSQNIRTVRYGTETADFAGSKSYGYLLVHALRYCYFCFII